MRKDPIVSYHVCSSSGTALIPRGIATLIMAQLPKVRFCAHTRRQQLRFKEMGGADGKVAYIGTETLEEFFLAQVKNS